MVTFSCVQLLVLKTLRKIIFLQTVLNLQEIHIFAFRNRLKLILRKSSNRKLYNSYIISNYIPNILHIFEILTIHYQSLILSSHNTSIFIWERQVIYTQCTAHWIHQRHKILNHLQIRVVCPKKIGPFMFLCLPQYSILGVSIISECEF